MCVCVCVCAMCARVHAFVCVIYSFYLVARIIKEECVTVTPQFFCTPLRYPKESLCYTPGISIVVHSVCVSKLMTFYLHRIWLWLFHSTRMAVRYSITSRTGILFLYWDTRELIEFLLLIGIDSIFPGENRNKSSWFRGGLSRKRWSVSSGKDKILHQTAN